MLRMCLLAMGLLVSGCATVPQRDRDVRAHGLALWVVQAGDAQVYLFGTMHLLPVPVAWLTPTVQTAFAGSREVWVEADLDDKRALAHAMSRAFDVRYDLSLHLPASEWSAVSAGLHGCGAPVERIAHLHPWAVNMLLMSCGLLDVTGHAGDAHIPASATPDFYLISTARATGVPVHGFETAEDQVAALADPPEAVQLKILHNVLESAEKAKLLSAEVRQAQARSAVMMVVGMEKSWFLGDTDAVARQMETFSKTGSPELYRSLFTQRNERFVDGIARLVNQQSHAFVAIGAAHFAGDDNVLAQLRTRGYVVRRVE